MSLFQRLFNPVGYFREKYIISLQNQLRNVTADRDRLREELNKCRLAGFVIADHTPRGDKEVNHG